MSVLALAVGNVLADAASDYDTLFGAEAKKVAATSYKTDDVRFAAKLLKAAQDMPDSPGLQVLLYTNSVQFSSGSVTGCDTALEALSLLEKAAPAQKAQWRSKKLDVVKYRFSKSYGAARKTAGGPYMDMLESEADAMAARGEGAEAKALYNRAYMIANYIKSPRAREILAKGKRANAIALQQVKVKSLQSKLKANAQDAASRKELIDLYVIAMDQPEKAAGLLNEDIDEATRTYVSLAAGKLDGLDEAICLELGDWYYLELSKNALAKGKPAILQRAAGYYQKFLKDHTKKDAQTYRVTAAMAKIAKDLEKLGASVDGPSFGRTITLDLGKNVTLELVHIPAGQFMMDSPKTEIGREDNEGPQRLVTISKPFYMGVTEVTQQQYKAVVGENPSKFQGPWKPVEMVSWTEATAFCRALSTKTGRTVRLPSEAQWEYACRAGSKTRYSFGNSEKGIDPYAWCATNSRGPRTAGRRLVDWPEGIASIKRQAAELVKEADAMDRAKKKGVAKHSERLRARAAMLLKSLDAPDAAKIKQQADKKLTDAQRLQTEAKAVVRANGKKGKHLAKAKLQQAQILGQDALRLYAMLKILPGPPRKPNAFGLYDMHGNVWEWCRDAYDETFYSKAKNVDPENTAESKTHVTRGGSWAREPHECRSAYRGFTYTHGRHFRDFGGFRVIVESK